MSVSLFFYITYGYARFVIYPERWFLPPHFFIYFAMPSIFNLISCLFVFPSCLTSVTRVPGDALRHWRRRLDMLKDKENADEGKTPF